MYSGAADPNPCVYGDALDIVPNDYIKVVAVVDEYWCVCETCWQTTSHPSCVVTLLPSCGPCVVAEKSALEGGIADGM
jgi:hypothetical protein